MQLHAADISEHAPRARRITSIDAHVGEQVRIMRNIRNLSQQALADRLGLSFQQIQKYETGTNRLNAGALWKLSQVLDVPVGRFFEGSPIIGGPPIPPVSEDEAALRDLLKSKTGLALVRAIIAISDRATRRHMTELAISIGGGQNGSEGDQEAL